MKEQENKVQYYITNEAYELVGICSKELNVKKSMFIDSLIKRYAEALKADIQEKITRYNDNRTDM